MKKTLIFILKLGVVALIFVWLFYRAYQDHAFEKLAACDKNIGWLTGGVLLNVAAILLTFIRWQWLVRALGVPLSTSEAIRLGSIGYVFNLSPMGIVGGDLVKGILLANQSPNAKAACAVSVIADRVIGLYAMFLLGLAAVGVTGFWRDPNPHAQFGTILILVLTVISTAGTIFLLIPESKHSWRRRTLRAIPLVGSLSEKLFNAAAVYRNCGKTLILSLAATFVVHILFALGLWCFALGLYGYAPTAMEHMAIYPIANCGSMVPLSAGPLETFLDLLYPLFPVAGEEIGAGFGMMVGLVYRLTTILLAAIGGVYCLVNRAAVGAALHQMREEESQKKTEAKGK